MKLLTLARDLARRKARERQTLFVAEGVRAVEALLHSGIEVRGALLGPQLGQTPRGAALSEQLRGRTSVEEVTAPDFDSASETDSPQGVLAIARIPSHGFGAIRGQDSESLRLLVLDGIQDPGNVGTILRSAAALGVTATVAMPGTVDLWNAKVVRSAMGAHFTHPAFPSTWVELDSFRGERGGNLELWGADRAGEPVERVALPQRLGVILGNEGAGLSAEARSRATRNVGLSIDESVESLNVGVAAGILLYELRRRSARAD